MAKFKTPHFEIIAATIRKSTENKVDEIVKQAAWHENTTQNIFLACAIKPINELVDQLCVEFTNDNQLFNETLFRAQCGKWISKTNLTDRRAS